jgi:hypothetical protein
MKNPPLGSEVSECVPVAAQTEHSGTDKADKQGKLMPHFSYSLQVKNNLP